MELVCYNIQIRGSEVPKHMLASVMESNDVNTEEDEGFYWICEVITAPYQYFCVVQFYVNFFINLSQLLKHS